MGVLTNICVFLTAVEVVMRDYEVVVYADSLIHHIVEGDTVITYRKPQIDGSDLPEGFPLPDGTLLDAGYISLQAESHPVEFKDIEILRIK